MVKLVRFLSLHWKKWRSPEVYSEDGTHGSLREESSLATETRTSVEYPPLAMAADSEENQITRHFVKDSRPEATKKLMDQPMTTIIKIQVRPMIALESRPPSPSESTPEFPEQKSVWSLFRRTMERLDWTRVNTACNWFTREKFFEAPDPPRERRKKLTKPTKECPYCREQPPSPWWALNDTTGPAVASPVCAKRHRLGWTFVDKFGIACTAEETMI